MQIAYGVFWYRTAEDYAHMLTVFTDSDELPDTYDEWLANAKHAEDLVRREGGSPLRAYVVPEDFAKWCADHDTNVDSQGRLDFANWFAARSAFGDRSDHPGSPV
jgi:hypothetical protein